MSAPLFPFTALVGLESLRLALQLAALDEHLSVLARGDKGAGKSTAARALGVLLAPGAPFVNVPLGATEDRLLGGLDVERAMRGEPALKPGLVSQAHGGVLYIDEVNLLPDHLADALLDAVASGVHVLEREGFSVTEEARFVLVGSMNPEEGANRSRCPSSRRGTAPPLRRQSRRVRERMARRAARTCAQDRRSERARQRCRLPDRRARLHCERNLRSEDPIVACRPGRGPRQPGAGRTR
jgi:magnesium chelatase subunit D